MLDDLSYHTRKHNYHFETKYSISTIRLTVINLLAFRSFFIFSGKLLSNQHCATYETIYIHICLQNNYCFMKGLELSFFHFLMFTNYLKFFHLHVTVLSIDNLTLYLLFYVFRNNLSNMTFSSTGNGFL